MKHNDDKRINTTLIPFRLYLIAWLIINAILIVYYFTLQTIFGDVIPLYALLLRHILISFPIVIIILEISRRYFYSNPLARIAKAARQVAKGDFSVRLEPIRRDGKKNEIEILIDDFNMMVKELSGIETLRNDFIANVSHELKSPLAVIQTYTTALKDNSLPLEQKAEYIDTITNAAQKLSLTITNILRLNRLENQKIYPTGVPFQLGEQLRRCALQFMERWQDKNIDFYIDVEDVLVNYDEALLEIVWDNLISNAIKFTPPNGKIELTSKKESGYIVMKVQDTGCGMTEEEKAHIFDKFYQGDTSHSMEGNGLGLSLVKKIVQIFEGEIVVETKPGIGSVFEVKLKM